MERISAAPPRREERAVRQAELDDRGRVEAPIPASDLLETSGAQTSDVEQYLALAHREVVVSPEQLQQAERVVLRILSEDDAPMPTADLLERAIALVNGEQTMPIRIALWNLLERGSVLRTSIGELVLGSALTPDGTLATSG